MIHSFLTDSDFAFLDEWLPPIPAVDLESIQRLWLEKWESGEKKPNWGGLFRFLRLPVC